jgi:hypothetical protein
MHLTYPDLDAHMGAASPVDSGDAGASGYFYGDYGESCAEPSYCTVAEIDPLREAVDRIYYDWWTDNDHSLSLGLPGDVLELRERLNAAFAKASYCILAAPREARNAPIAVSKPIT